MRCPARVRCCACAPRAARTAARAPTSSTSYGHTTIPRHLRDIAITEYGIADLRGRTDGECVAAMLNIADSRFQDELLAAAKRAHKIDAGYRIPEEFRRNTPERLEEAFAAQRRAGLFSEYPFGTDLTREEIDLARALRWLKENTGSDAAAPRLLARALFTPAARRRIAPISTAPAARRTAEFRRAPQREAGEPGTARDRAARACRLLRKQPRRILERLEFERVAGRVVEEHRRLLAHLAREADAGLDFEARAESSQALGERVPASHSITTPKCGTGTSCPSTSL